MKQIITTTKALIKIINENEMKEVRITKLDYLIFGECVYLVIINS